MPRVPNLTREQNAALTGIKVGDFLLIKMRQEHVREHSLQNRCGCVPRCTCPGHPGIDIQIDPEQPFSRAVFGQDASDSDEALFRMQRDSLNALCTVVGIKRDQRGRKIDVEFKWLIYNERPMWILRHETYQLYGPIIEKTSYTYPEPTSQNPVFNLATLPVADRYAITVNPNGYEACRAVFGDICPAYCTDGRLDSTGDLQQLVSEELPGIQDYRPVCPRCMGKPLAFEELAIRCRIAETFQDARRRAMAFTRRLSTARRAQGLRGASWNVDDWDLAAHAALPDIMPPGREAIDDDEPPVILEDAEPQPANEDDVAAIPRVAYGSISHTVAGQGQSLCVICRSDFAVTDYVRRLPCGHIFCNEGCIQQWFETSDTCPVCRRVLESEEL